MEINAEGGEITLQNENGDVAIIPKIHRQKVLGWIKNGDYKSIDELVGTLPTMEDYAEDGSIYFAEGGNITTTETTPLEGPGEPDETRVIPKLKTTSSFNSVISDKLPFYTGTLDPNKQYDREKLLRTMLANETYAASGQAQFSLEELDAYKQSKESFTDAELIESANLRMKTAPILAKSNEMTMKKASETENIDFTNIVDKSIEHYKKNYGKSNKEFYNVKSENIGFKNTPLHKDIYKRVIEAADRVGLDRYTALGLAMVESNFGKGYRDKNAGSIYESNLFSNWDGKNWPKSKYINMNEGPINQFQSYLVKKGKNIESLSTEDLNKEMTEFSTELEQLTPSAKTGTEAALLYYKKNPKGYNSGNKNYVTTVEAAANVLRADKENLDKWVQSWQND